MIYNMWTVSCSIQISNTTWFKLTSRWNLGKPMKTWLIVREKSVKIEDILHVCSFRHKVRPCGHKTFEQSQHCIYNIHSVLIGQFWSMSSKFVLKSFMTVRLDWVVSDVYEECCIKHMILMRLTNYSDLFTLYLSLAILHWLAALGF